MEGKALWPGCLLVVLARYCSCDQPTSGPFSDLVPEVSDDMTWAI